MAGEDEQLRQHIFQVPLLASRRLLRSLDARPCCSFCALEASRPALQAPASGSVSAASALWPLPPSRRVKTIASPQTSNGHTSP